MKSYLNGLEKSSFQTQFHYHHNDALPPQIRLFPHSCPPTSKIPSFLDYETYFSPPKFGRKLGGASYSLNVAYICIGESMLFMLLNILLHFWLQKFFPYFSPLKPRCILWSKKYGKSFISAKRGKNCCQNYTREDSSLQLLPETQGNNSDERFSK